MHPFIDIHSHILPGIDDGLNHLAETLETFVELKKLGIGTIFCTPHQKEGSLNPPLLSIDQVFDAVVDEAGSQIRLFKGVENYFDPQFYERVSQRTVPTYGGSPYFLFELPPFTPVARFEDLVFQMNINGYHPILAHIERYEWIKASQLKALHSSMLYQVNITSFVEEVTPKARFKKVIRLMEKGLIDFLATDLHNKEIIPRVGEGMAFIEDHYGAETLHRLFSRNPRKIVKAIKSMEGPTS
ncbi:hypothetical protein KKF84_19170 [Myxococcota bacterium]|nr:hypothetical protein [Myxococcota bacterium]